MSQVEIRGSSIIASHPLFTPSTAVYCCVTGRGSTTCAVLLLLSSINCEHYTYQVHTIRTLLLYCCCCCCCCCSAHRGCVIAFEVPRKCEFVRTVVLPLRIKLIARFSRLFMCSFLLPRSAGITAHTRAHTQVRCPWPSLKAELDERLLLCRGCFSRELEGRCDQT